MLKITNISKEFNLTGNIEDRRVALADVSLTIKDGEFVTIIGGNGSGKTTLMNLIAGGLLQDSGTIEINNRDVSRLNEHQRAKFLGRVFQDPNLGTAKDMSILENMEIAMRRTRKSTLKWGFNKDNKTYFVERLSTLNLGLENRLTQKVGLLSGGQRQALTLIMATLSQPDLLLLDEHTAALDPKTSKIVLEITNKIVTSNKLTTIMITHNMQDAITYGNRLIMLHNGRIIYDVKGEEKKKLTTQELVAKFESTADTSML